MKIANCLAAIAGITFLSAWAIYLGYDGVIFLTTVGVLSGLGGYPILNKIKDTYELKVVKDFLGQEKKAY